MGQRSWRLAACLCAGAAVLGGSADIASATLPDGRSYELVSPAVKSGGVGSASGLLHPRATADGEHVFYTAVDPLPGSASGFHGNDYRSDRTTAGWLTTALMPPPQNGEPTALIDTWLGSSDDGSVSLLRGSQALDPSDQDEAFGWPASDLYLRAADGTYVWVSKGEISTNLPSNPIDWGVLSRNGKHVVFGSVAPLLPEDAARTDGQGLYDWSGGTLKLVAVGNDGALLSPSGVTIGAYNALNPDLRVGHGLNAVSGDGSRIVFTVDGRVYVRVSGSSTLSVAPGGALSGGQTFQGATPDGEEVFFTTDEALTPDDQDGLSDLYRFDLGTEQVTRISSGSDHDAQGADVRLTVGARSSDDGSRVYFAAAGALTPNAVAHAPNAGPQTNLYLDDHGVTRLVAEPNVNDLGRGPTCGDEWHVSQDGATVAFATSRALTPDDTDASADVYIYRLGSGLTRVSGSGDSGNDPIDAVLGGSRATCGSDLPPYSETRALSNDGRFVFFQSAEGLVAQDANQRNDVYRYDASDGSIALISGGLGAQNSLYLDSSASGSDVFFATFDPLSTEDVDDKFDVYDARIGGRSPARIEPPAPCRDDDCQGAALGGVPGPVNPASGEVQSLPSATVKKATLTLSGITAAQRRQAARDGRLKVRLRASIAGRVSLTLRMGPARHRVVAGAVAVTIKAGVVRTATVVLNRRARRHLAQRHRLGLAVRAVLMPGHVTRRAHVDLRTPRGGRAARAASAVASIARNR